MSHLSKEVDPIGTVEEVEGSLRRIREQAEDSEANAHCAQDRLYFGVLMWIAENGTGQAQALAAAAIEADEIEFSRWYE